MRRLFISTPFDRPDRFAPRVRQFLGITVGKPVSRRLSSPLLPAAGPRHDPSPPLPSTPAPPGTSLSLPTRFDIPGSTSTGMPAFRCTPYLIVPLPRCLALFVVGGFLARETVCRPGNSLQPLQADLPIASQACTVGAVLNTR